MVVGTWNTTKSRENAPTSSDKFGCPCGRSPTGKCIGWHRLSDAGYVDMYAKYQKVPESEQEEFFKNNKVPKKVKIEVDTNQEAQDEIASSTGKADFHEHMLKEKKELEESMKESFRQRDERKRKEKKKDVINPDTTVLFDLHNINRMESDDFDPGQE